MSRTPFLPYGLSIPFLDFPSFKPPPPGKTISAPVPLSWCTDVKDFKRETPTLLPDFLNFKKIIKKKGGGKKRRTLKSGSFLHDVFTSPKEDYSYLRVPDVTKFDSLDFFPKDKISLKKIIEEVLKKMDYEELKKLSTHRKTEANKKFRDEVIEVYEDEAYEDFPYQKFWKICYDIIKKEKRIKRKRKGLRDDDDREKKKRKLDKQFMFELNSKFYLRKLKADILIDDSRLVNRLYKLVKISLPRYSKGDMNYELMQSHKVFILECDNECFFKRKRRSYKNQLNERVVPIIFAFLRYCKDCPFDQITLLSSDLELKDDGNIRGAGTVLMNELKKFAFKKDKRLCAFIDPKAEGFYKKMNFKPKDDWEREFKREWQQHLDVPKLVDTKTGKTLKLKPQMWYF